MEFEEVINKRKSIRKFIDKIVEREKIGKLLNIILKAPSGGNLQAYKIFVLSNKNIQKKLVPLAKNQSVLEEATYVLIFCIDINRSKEKYGNRGEILYALQDTTIACTYAHLAAVDLGLSSVWIGGFNEEAVKEILKIPEDLRPVAMLPIGYAGIDPENTSRRNPEDIVKFIM